MHFEIFSYNLVEYSNIEILPISVVVDRGRGSVGSVDNERIFHSHPGCEHTSEWPSEHDDGAVVAVSLLDKSDELNEIHHGLVSGQVH